MPHDLPPRSFVLGAAQRSSEAWQSRNLQSTRRTLPLISAILLLFGPMAADAQFLKTIDLYPGFFRCFEASSKPERVKWFSQEVIQLHPEIYRRRDIFKTDPATLEKYLDQVAAYLPTITKIHARFLDECQSIEESFSTRFPDFQKSRIIIYLMPSLFRFDGKIPHDNPRALLLGLDGLAKFHGKNAPLGVILSHELFHLYHFQVNVLPSAIDSTPLYRLIWQEGLATYVSGLLNPGTSLSDLLLDPRLAREGPKHVPTIACSLLPQLESADDETASRYLSYRRGSKVPSRMGYLIGYRIASHLASTRTLKELTRLRGQRLLKLMRAEVRAMAAPQPWEG
jgi:hypothetical protein